VRPAGGESACAAGRALFFIADAILSIVANPLIFRLFSLAARRTARAAPRAGSA